MCYPVCGMVHIKEPLLLLGKSSLCGGSGFPLSLSEWIGAEPAPRVILTDFEVAAIQAMYLGADIRECFFLNVISHLSCVEYLQRYVRRADALPLHQLNQVQDVWMNVLNKSPHSPRLEQFNNYITETWVTMSPDFSYYSGTSGSTWDLGPTTILKGSTIS